MSWLFAFVFTKSVQVTLVVPFVKTFDCPSNFTPSAYKSNVTSGFTVGSVASFSAAHSFVAVIVIFSGSGITFFCNLFVIVKPSVALPLVVTVYVSSPEVNTLFTTFASWTV